MVLDILLARKNNLLHHGLHTMYLTHAPMDDCDRFDCDKIGIRFIAGNIAMARVLRLQASEYTIDETGLNFENIRIGTHISQHSEKSPLGEYFPMDAWKTATFKVSRDANNARPHLLLAMLYHGKELGDLQWDGKLYSATNVCAPQQARALTGYRWAYLATCDHEEMFPPGVQDRLRHK